MIVWIFGSFILTQLYSDELFKRIMTSVPVPIVNSAEELADKSGVDLLVAEGFSPDLKITVKY